MEKPVPIGELTDSRPRIAHAPFCVAIHLVVQENALVKGPSVGEFGSGS